MAELPNPRRGLLMDGIICSEAVDSSGEVLDVKGADISSLTVDGVLNFEHRGEQDKASSFDDIVGRFIVAKKIFTADDCANDREKMYWDKCQLPFVYGVARLFDESDHTNAKALAAIIRDQHAAGEPLIVRWSVEGSTIEKEGNVLKHTIARRVAATIKPANKSAVTGLLHDPKAPKEASAETSDLLAGLADDAKKFEHPGFTRLQSNDFGYVPFDADDAVQRVLDATREVRKTITAGSYNVAPGQLSGGAALQVEDLGERRKRVQSVCKAAVRDWDMVKHPDFKKYLASLALNQGLGEMSDDFLDMFNELAYDVHVSKRTAGLQKGEDEEGGEDVQVEGGIPHGVGHPKYKIPKKDPEEYKNPFGIKREKHNTDTSYFRAVAQATYDRNLGRIKSARAGGEDSFNFGANANIPSLPPSEEAGEPEGRPEEIKRGRGFFDPRTGWLHTPVRSYKAYAPDQDDEEYRDVMLSPDVQRVHDTAIRNWMVVHNLAKQGKLPDLLVAGAALNSMMSPNCSVYVQEACDGHLWDMQRRGWDPTKPMASGQYDTLHKQFLAFMENNPDEANPEDVHERNGKLNVLPVFMREHYDHPESNLWLTKEPDQRIKLGFEHQRWGWASRYHLMHDHLKQLVADHRTDGRAASLALMNLKVKGKQVSDRQERQRKAGKPVDEYADSKVEGLAPKTGRYTMGMLGMGNSIVNDTHFIRHIFGMMSPDPRIDDLKATLNRPQNEHMLQSMDNWFMANHPAFKHTVEKVKKQYGVDLGEQANFLSFWLHWLTIGRHELRRGWQSDATNEATDHMVFWNHAKNVLKEEGIPWTDHRKSEEGLHEHERPLLLRAARAFHHIEHNFGYTPACFIWHSFIVPHLLSHSEEHQVTMKAERLTTGILALAALMKKDKEGSQEEEEKPVLHFFKGKAVQAGVLGSRSDGKQYPLVSVGRDFHHIVGNDGLLFRFPSERGSIIKPPKTVRANTRVDAMKHGVPHLAEDDHQRDLLEGLDMTKRLGHPAERGKTAREEIAGGVPPTAGWYESAAGLRGYVKPAALMNDELDFLGGPELSSAHREAIFHAAASKFFGLGEHVPVTAAFQHPVTGETHSVQEEVKGDHYKKKNPMHQSVMVGNLHSGTLDKLALMDMVMNHSDRHLGNFMVSKDGAQVHLIDNGLIFAPGSKHYHPAVPYYWDKAGSLVYGRDDWPHEPLHPEAEHWVQGLEPEKFDTLLAHWGVPAKLRQESVRRLVRLKDKVAKGGATKMGAYFAPFMSKTKAQPGTDEVPFIAEDDDMDEERVV